MSAHTSTVLGIIRTAAEDCRAQGNTMAQNELLGAAVTVYNMLDALQTTADNLRSIATSASADQYLYGPLLDVVEAAIASATSQPEGGA